MISDLCLIILINSLGLENDELEVKGKDNKLTYKNPLNIYHKKGKEIHEFLIKNGNNTILSPIMVIWNKLCLFYKQY